MKETFEEYLGRVHIEEESMTIDDDLPDAYEHWLGNLGIDLMIAHAEKWHVEQLLAAINK